MNSKMADNTKINLNPLLICDSRGANIKEHMKIHGYSVQVITCPGKGIFMSTLEALKVMRHYNPNLVTLVGSVCDITYKQKPGNKVCLRFTTVDEIVSFYMDQLNQAISIITDLHPQLKIQCTPVIGLDLTDYNHPGYKHLKGQAYEEYKKSKKRDPNQDILEEATVIINREIMAVNINNDITTPWTANCVQPMIKGRTHFKYERLTDGCHLSAKVRVQWAKLLALSYRKIQKKHFTTD